MKSALTEKLQGLSTDQIAEVAACMFNDSSEEGGIVLEAALTILELKMSDSDFARFCNKLAA